MTTDHDTAAVLTEAERLALGVTAARAIRYNLPVDAFGDRRRLEDYADIWGAAARTALLVDLERILAARLADTHPAHGADEDCGPCVADYDREFRDGLAAQPPQDDPQPDEWDEREESGEVRCEACGTVLANGWCAWCDPDDEPYLPPPQPDEREALAWAIHRACGCDGSCRPDTEDESAADAVLAAGFRCGPDAGLREVAREALESLDDQCREDDRYGTQMRAHEVRDAISNLRAALAEPTPGSES